MKHLFYKLIAMVLTIVMISSATLNVYAAPSRNKGTVKYLSEVILLEAKDITQAKKMLDDLKAKGIVYEGVVDLNLNDGGDTGVFLAYKSSANVDDAITDLAVMNMGGDYSIGGYEQLFKQTMDRYVGIVKDYRIMAKEFKANYDAGDIGAITAHRQMNYYYLEKNGVKTYMGDYMLNFPATDEEFAEVLFSGNLNIIANVRSLLAMGTGNDTLFSDRVKQAYIDEAKNPGLYSKAEYDDAAKSLRTRLTDMKKALDSLPSEIEEIRKSTELSAEDKKALIDINTTALDQEKALLALLNTITIGDTDLGKIVIESPVITIEQLCPIIGAATEAERLLIEYDTFYEVMLYEELSLVGEDLDNALKEFEKDYTPLSVFHGVQNDLINGTVGVTGAADILSSSTSNNYVSSNSKFDIALQTGGLAVLGVAGAASMYSGIAYLISASKLSVVTGKAALQQALAEAMQNVTSLEHSLHMAKNCLQNANTSNMHFQVIMYADDVQNFTSQLVSAKAEVAKATAAVNAGAKSSLKFTQILSGGFFIVLGITCMALSIYGIVSIYNKYNPLYSDIPDNMVDVVLNKTLGDRFINYNNVKSYFYDGDEVVARNNDLNIYDGVQWVSLYYTKNYEAGYCLTTTADLIAEETPRAGHSPIHLFGRTTNYNLNSFCGREDASDVYLAFKYSTNKKSAETDIPDIIGSSFNPGFMIVSATCGLGLGFGAGMFLMFKRNKKKFPTITE